MESRMELTLTCCRAVVSVLVQSDEIEGLQGGNAVTLLQLYGTTLDKLRKEQPSYWDGRKYTFIGEP